MSDNRILELLKNAKVEWKPLEDVVNIFDNLRKPIKASLRKTGNNPYYGANNIQDYVEGFTHDGEFVLIAEDGSSNLSSYSIQWVNGKFWANNHVHVVNGKQNLNNKFLYHYLLSINFIPYLTGGDRAKLTKSQMIQIPIPIPPLEIQSEIVRILDSFTALTTELTTELNARKKQYNYYRDQLLTFSDDEVEWKKLSSLCVIGDGLHGTPSYDDLGNYYFINGNNLNGKNIILDKKTKKVNDSIFKKYGKNFTLKNTIFLSINGTIGNVSFFNNEKIVLGKSVAYFNIESPSLNIRFLFYYLQTTSAKKYYDSNKTGSTIKNLGLKALREFKIPIPPLKKQAEIVEILDKFDSLTTSITEGLPREIELRKKQYEYYCDLLLTFPKPDNK